MNLPYIIFYFSVINLSFDFLLPYLDNDEFSKKGKIDNKQSNENEFVPIKINYDNDDVYRRFNDLAPLYTYKRRYFNRNINPLRCLTIYGERKKK